MSVSYTLQGVRVQYDEFGTAAALASSTLTFWASDPAGLTEFGSFRQNGTSALPGFPAGGALDEVTFSTSADAVLIDDTPVDPLVLETPGFTAYLYEITYDLNTGEVPDERTAQVIEIVDGVDGYSFIYLLAAAADLPALATAGDWNGFLSINLTEVRRPDFGPDNTLEPDWDAADTIVATEADLVVGTDGDDWPAGPGPALLNGGVGNDTILGLGGDDIAELGQGDDVFYGGTGFDLVDYEFEWLNNPGAASGVIVDLGAGLATDTYGDTDTLIDVEGAYGTDLADLLIAAPGGADFYGNAGNDTISGGAGLDMARYDNDPGAIDVDLGAGTAIDGFGNQDALTSIEGVFGSDFADTLTGDSADNLLVGGNDNDTLIGLGGADLLFGQAGTDSLAGSEGNDTLDGGEGADTLHGEDDTDLLRGGAGFDSLTGGSGNDRMFGDAGNDTLEGGTEDDVLYGGGGMDALDGQSGADLIVGGAGNDSMQGGIGNDTLRGGENSDRVNGGGDHDLIEGGNGNDTAWGAAGDDTIDGGAGRDLIEGDGGADSLSGGDGNDRMFGDAGGDMMDGGADADFMVGGAGDDTVGGGDGADRVYGGGGRDSLTGGEEADQIVGGFGADTLLGGAGQDTLDGGEHRDQLRGGADGDLMFGGNGEDAMFGEAGNDSMSGGDGGDFLYGNAGNDTMVGGDGGDLMQGNNGQDTLDGGEGADTLAGGIHNDFLVGGTEADVFVFGLNDGADTVSDFEDGVDLVRFAGTGLGFGDLVIGGEVNATVTGAGLGVITLTGVDASQLTSDDFDFV